MSNPLRRGPQRGFTLIELMIVVAIIAILAAIAYPNYQDSVRRANQADAQGALSGLAGALERFYTQNGTYAGAAVGAGGIYSNQSPVGGGQAIYNLEITSADATSYVIRAVPVAGGMNANVDILGLTSVGQEFRDLDDDGAVDAGEEGWEH